jgi:hypothetical protein
VAWFDGDTGTAEPFLYGFTLDGNPVALLDTPGFDDTYKTDADVLKTVADFLAHTYKKNIRLSGIIYLQRITDPRITHGGRANLALFRALCGDDPLRKVVLATTFWGEMNNLDRARQHEEELKTNPEYWGDMLTKKATMTRFHDTQESAFQILRGLMQNEEKISLKIQTEMVDYKLDLDKTTAGESLNQELTRMAAKYAKDLDRHKEEVKAALMARDLELQEIKADQVRKTKELLHKMQNQKETLNARRRDELRMQDMKFDAHFQRLVKEQEVPAPPPLVLPLKDCLPAKHTQTEAIKQLEDEIQELRTTKEKEGEERERCEKAIAEKEEKAKIKRQRVLEIAGAIGTTATAAGLSVLNPLAIPVAFGGLISLINACFSRNEKHSLEQDPDTYRVLPSS